ncbi:hypothetical protein MUP01_07990 [Candidatus Bathyarchaeota archaeon]|nr:hypothetical protein [Candidatus Bathyarchaeota archaeon]
MTNKPRKLLSIQPNRELRGVLTDHKLASPGDSFINFAYSLALSSKKGSPLGIKVKGSLLAEALRRAGLREYLPARMTTHILADAAEALIVYVWLLGLFSLEETVAILEQNDDPVDNLSRLLEKIKTRIKHS